ncbi:mannose-1-phosphate guanylyltransferase [Nocardioides marmoraquaticus]
MSDDVLPRLWAVVPAGGAGTRLWPLSRAQRPKFLLDLTGAGRTLLQGTVDRLQPLVGDRVVVVTGAAHERAVRRQLPGVPRVLAEPAPRDSMAAIGWAAAVLEREHPDAIIGSFAADHVVLQTDEFRDAVREAAAVAATGRLVTIGIEPTGPSTAFGYVAGGAPLDGFATALAVREFVEKPDAARAAAYVASGEYRWNAGMFLVGATRLLDLLAGQHPDLAEGLRAVAADPSSLERRWPGLRRIAIDHAVAEPAAAAGHVAMVPGPFAWEDLGDFAALADLQGREPGLRVLGDPAHVVGHDSSGLVVPGGRRLVGVVGLDDVVVVDTGDAVLVTTTERAQDVKALVEELKRTGRGDLT